MAPWRLRLIRRAGTIEHMFAGSTYGAQNVPER